MKDGIRFKRDEHGKLREFEIGWKPIAALIGIISLPFVAATKLVTKIILIISITIQGLLADPASFYIVSNPSKA
jgi:hypothetical protein